MMKTTIAFFVAVAVASVVACSSDDNTAPPTNTADTGVIEDSGKEPADTSVPVDTGTVDAGHDAGGCVDTLPTEVATFLNSNCMPCHSASNRSGGISLSSYATVKPVAEVALGEITQGGMPIDSNRNPKPLAAADYKVFKDWVDGGKKSKACP